LQYKNKRNLYKILFITILLGFIISLVGCNWLSLGLLNIFDPQAQIRINYNTSLPTSITNIDLENETAQIIEFEEGEGTINLEIFCINQVEFKLTGFSYEYSVVEYNKSQKFSSTKIPSLSRISNVLFYIEPSDSPGSPGPKTTISIPLLFIDVVDYFIMNPLVTEVLCDLKIIGTDGSGHDQIITVGSNIPVISYGVDFYDPVAIIDTIPSPPSGNAPLTVVFDASQSYDIGRGISTYLWGYGDNTSGSGILNNHTYSNVGQYIVTLTVTDYYGNEGYDTVIVTVEEPEEGEEAGVCGG